MSCDARALCGSATARKGGGATDDLQYEEPDAEAHERGPPRNGAGARAALARHLRVREEADERCRQRDGADNERGRQKTEAHESGRQRDEHGPQRNGADYERGRQRDGGEARLARHARVFCVTYDRLIGEHDGVQHLVG